MRAAGCTHVVMEVTSSALAMERAVGLRFAVAAFSNLTQDHLDVHGSMAAYRDAKRRLFAELLAPDGVAVVNVDDPEGEGMGAAARGARVLARVDRRRELRRHPRRRVSRRPCAASPHDASRRRAASSRSSRAR